MDLNKYNNETYAKYLKDTFGYDRSFKAHLNRMKFTTEELEWLFKSAAMGVTQYFYNRPELPMPSFLQNVYVEAQTWLDRKMPGRSAQILRECENEMEGNAKVKSRDDEISRILESQARKAGEVFNKYACNGYKVPKRVKMRLTRTLMDVEKYQPGRGQELHAQIKKQREMFLQKAHDSLVANQALGR